MKNNKMKKMISMMVAILFAFSALTVQASAAWYEYTGYDLHYFGTNFEESYAAAEDNGEMIEWRTHTQGDNAIYVSVEASAMYNLGNGTWAEYFNEVVEQELMNGGYSGDAVVNTSDIESDYTFSFCSSYHYVESAEHSDYIYIDSSSR